MGWQEPGKHHFQTAYICIYYVLITPISLSLSYTSTVAFQLATIGLAADENPIGVVLGGIL